MNEAILSLLGGPSVVPRNAKPLKWPIFDKQDEEAVIVHLRNHDLSAYEVIDGPLYDFEKELTKYFKSNHALLVGSGTAALYSAYTALKLTFDDEIIIPTITFPGTGTVALHFDCKIRLIDVESETGNPSIEQIVSSITENTKAVVVAHAWGMPIDTMELKNHPSMKNIVVIEDAARACGSTIRGIPAGGIGDMGIISFQEQKAVPAGEGGLFLTSNDEYYEHAVALGHYFRAKEKQHLSKGQFFKYFESGLGLNLEIHPLAATLAHCQFKKLDQSLNSMLENYNHLIECTKMLEHFKFLVVPSYSEKISFYGFNFLYNFAELENLPSKKTIIKALRAEGIKASDLGSPPLNELPIFNDISDSALKGKVVGSLDTSNFAGAHLHYKSLIRLPAIRNVENAMDWVQYMAESLIKIHNSLFSLYEWEKAN